MNEVNWSMVNDWPFIAVAIGIVLSGSVLVLSFVLHFRARRRAEFAATSTSQRAQQLFAEAPVGLCQLALDGRFIRCNNALLQLLGLPLTNAALPAALTAILHPEDERSAVVIQRELLSGGDNGRWESRLLHRQGHFFWARVMLTVVRGDDGQAVYFMAAISDISEQKRNENIERETREKLSTLIEHVAAAMWMASADGQRLVFANEACEAVFGCARANLYADSSSLQRLIHPEDVTRVQRVLTARAAGSYAVNYRILRDDGEQRYIREIGKGVHDAAGRLQYIICSAMDISSEMDVRDELHGLNSLLREANLRLLENARRDSLTQCLNRSAFLDEAEKALQMAQRYGRSSTLIFFDLNDFKQINDNFGHHVGDRGLIEFAEQIKIRLRTTDELGRYGGDEFVVLLRETDAEQAQQLLSTLAPVVIGAENGNSIILRYSAGVACSDDSGIDGVDDWLRRADSQMYNQKIRRNG